VNQEVITFEVNRAAKHIPQRQQQVP